MVGEKGLFELKKCTVSGLKRQFDKWHLFSASTCRGVGDEQRPNTAKNVPQNWVLPLISGHRKKATEEKA